MYMDSSLTLWLPHVQLAQLRIRLGLPVKEVVLERDAMTKPSSPERMGQPVRRVQVGNRDLYIYDVLGAKPWNGGRADVVDSNRDRPDQIADVLRDPRELLPPVRLIRPNPHRAAGQSSSMRCVQTTAPPHRPKPTPPN